MRLTVAQALVRFLAAQRLERDGESQPFFAGCLGIFGHGNLSDRVRLTGHQDPLPYYRAADAILLPSIREGFSLVCAEAMATGVPALRTRTSGTHELIQEGVTGRSTPIDHDAFVSAAVEFLKDGAALRQMGAAASRHVRETFTFEQQLSRTIDLYRSISTQTP